MKRLIMLLALTCAIVFQATAQRGALTVKNAVSVEIESSWQSLTDKATVKMPSRYLFREQSISIKDYLKKGDPVSISLGYANDRQEVFFGYISDVGSKVPTEIICEDAMYKLKRTPVNVIFQKTTLLGLLSQIVPSSIPIEALDVDLGAFKASNTTVAKVLEKIKDKYGLVSYIQNGTLYCGKVHIYTSSPVATFHFEKNIQSNDLRYRTRDEHPIKVTAISNLLNGSKIQVTVGDDEGEERTLNYFNIDSEAELRSLAEADYEKLAVDGYSGSLLGYGQPMVKHSQSVQVVSTDYPERDGSYFVDAVKTRFRRGFTQEITLGKQL